MGNDVRGNIHHHLLTAVATKRLILAAAAAALCIQETGMQGMGNQVGGDIDQAMMFMNKMQSIYRLFQ